MTAPVGLKRPKGPAVVERPVATSAKPNPTLKTSKPTAPAQPSAKPKVEKESKGPSAKGLSCLCGCGQATVTDSAKFIPGHDAKLKGKLLQVERGELPKNQVPEIAKPFLQKSSVSGAWSFPTESGMTPDEDKHESRPYSERKAEIEEEKAEKAKQKAAKLAALKAKGKTSKAAVKKPKAAVEENEEEAAEEEE